MRVTAKIRELMFEGASSTEIREAAIEEEEAELTPDEARLIVDYLATLYPSK